MRKYVPCPCVNVVSVSFERETKNLLLFSLQVCVREKGSKRGGGRFSALTAVHYFFQCSFKQVFCLYLPSTKTQHRDIFNDIYILS